jgi:hypothetical protein
MRAASTLPDVDCAVQKWTFGSPNLFFRLGSSRCVGLLALQTNKVPAATTAARRCHGGGHIDDRPQAQAFA